MADLIPRSRCENDGGTVVTVTSRATALRLRTRLIQEHPETVVRIFEIPAARPDAVEWGIDQFETDQDDVLVVPKKELTPKAIWLAMCERDLEGAAHRLRNLVAAHRERLNLPSPGGHYGDGVRIEWDQGSTVDGVLVRLPALPVASDADKSTDGTKSTDSGPPRPILSIDSQGVVQQPRAVAIAATDTALRALAELFDRYDQAGMLPVGCGVSLTTAKRQIVWRDKPGGRFLTRTLQGPSGKTRP
jgi:hypothetical protein